MDFRDAASPGPDQAVEAFDAGRSDAAGVWLITGAALCLLAVPPMTVAGTVAMLKQLAALDLTGNAALLHSQYY